MRPGFKMSVSPPVSAVRPDNVTAAFMLIAAVLMSTFETVLIRLMGESISIWQAVLFRGYGQVLVVVVWSMRRGTLPNMRSDYPWLHFARGLASISGWWLYYWTFQNLGVAMATLLTFAASLFVVVLAGPVLGERVRAVSWVTTIIGFCGIAIATGVGTVSFDTGVVIGLVSAALLAAIVFLTRALAQTEDTLTIMTYIGLCVMAAAVPMAWINWMPLGYWNAFLMLVAGVLGAFSMILLIEAYRRGEAAVLAPIPFVRLALAMVLGYLVFAEVPDLKMVVGSVIVVGSALYALHHEQRRKQRGG